jgi:1-aminocyclopropane-1-carboxylate deaminase/D-cysteine desulfhydrase-like pyridoxal-dependent ACC family enzyme
LALGVKALGLDTRVIGLTPIRWNEDRPTDIARIAGATAERLGLDIRFQSDDIYNDDEYVGDRYGVMTPGCREALKLVANTEGIILDPVYSSKAMAGLIDHIRQGRIKKNEVVVFLHTGGTPALFAYVEDLELTS